MEWAAELYAHAIAVEREAALRYAELAWRMAGQGSEEAARLFAEFAALQATHLSALQRRTQDMSLPDLTCDHSWPEDGAPLANALQAERDARAFFEQARRVSFDPAARAIAEEMVGEENEHITRIERLVASPPCTGTS
jgi:rubrerythrin